MKNKTKNASLFVIYSVGLNLKMYFTQKRVGKTRKIFSFTQKKLSIINHKLHNLNRNENNVYLFLLN